MTLCKRYEIKNNKSTNKILEVKEKDYFYKGVKVESINFLECTAWSPSVYIYCNDNLKGWVFLDELTRLKE